MITRNNNLSRSTISFATLVHAFPHHVGHLYYCALLYYVGNVVVLPVSPAAVHSLHVTSNSMPVTGHNLVLPLGNEGKTRTTQTVNAGNPKK